MAATAANKDTSWDSAAVAVAASCRARRRLLEWLQHVLDSLAVRKVQRLELALELRMP